jgi:hypothetical protein
MVSREECLGGGVFVVDDREGCLGKGVYAERVGGVSEWVRGKD